MNKKIILTAALLGVVAIVLGAFGAHTLKKFLTVEQLASFEVGVRYMMYHALFLLFLATTPYLQQKQKKAIYFLTLFGIVLFSGSIFLLSTTALSGIDFKFLGPFTPLGGALFITAWVWLFINIAKSKS